MIGVIILVPTLLQIVFIDTILVVSCSLIVINIYIFHALFVTLVGCCYCSLIVTTSILIFFKQL